MAFRSINSNNTAANPIVVTAPASVVSGDILVAAVTIDGAGDETITWPSGFTEVTGSPGYMTVLDGQTFGVAIKVATGSEPGSYTITPSAGTATATVAAWSGRDATVTPHKLSFTGQTSQITSPGDITTAAFGSATSVDGCDMVYIATIDNATNAATSFTSPSGFTEQLDISNSLKCHLTLGTLDNQASGQTGALTGTVTIGTQVVRAAYAVLALAPSAATGTTLYFLDSAASGSNFGQLQFEGSAPSTATTATGWTVDTVGATNYALMAYASERLSSVFSGTAQPAGNPDNSLGDCFRSTNTLSGDFATGAWTIAIPVIAVSAAAGQDGRVRVRLWKSANATGTSPTEITSGAVAGTTVTNLTTGAEQVSTVTTSSITGFSMANEYLFVQVAWEITGAAT